MQTEQITINVDPETAEVFKAVSPQERKKLEILLNIRLKEATKTSGSLKQIMREISHKAQERGLTPEILRSILDED